MRVNVLWIDDEYIKQEDFIGQAEQEGIDIFPFESHEEGIAELINKLPFFHAVILDAKVKELKNSTTTGLSGLRASRDRLIELNKEHYIPYFIFTGQPDYIDSNQFAESYGRYYIKGDDNDELFLAIKDAVENKVEYKLQRKYKDVFTVCSDAYIGSDCKSTLLQALKLIESVKENLTTEDLFNSIRKIIEKLFLAFNRQGFLPDEVVRGKGWINQSSIFLSGNHSSYKMNSEILSSTIAFLLKNILLVIQDASHAEGTLKLKVDNHVREIRTPYLFTSSIYQLLDILLWFKKYVDDNPDIEKNKLIWFPLENLGGDWEEGEVINKKPNGFAFFKPDIGKDNTFIPHDLVSENLLVNNDRVKVIIERHEGSKPIVKQLKKII